MNNNDKLRILFEQSKHSQCVFADKISISQPQLNKYLSNTTKLPDSTLKRLKRNYTISYYVDLILHKLECFLNTKDVDKTSFEFEVQHNNLNIECYVHNAKHAYRNYYNNDGECIGKYKPEPDHTYEFEEVCIKAVFDEAKEEHIEWEYKEEINLKLYDYDNV